jgi:hypothetical protein
MRFLLSVALLGGVWLGMLGTPAALAQQQGLAISVEPLIVQFTISPGGQASTRVLVSDVGTEPVVVVASQFDWRTTVDGRVTPERPGTEGAASLSQYLRLSATNLALRPGESREMTLSLALPSTFPATARSYWGGYLVRAVPQSGATTSTFGVGANILIYDTVGSPSRHLKVTNLSVQGGDPGDVRVLARMVNDGETYVRPQISMKVAQAGRLVQSQDDSTPAIFSGSPRDYARTISNLAPGSYQLELTIDYGGDTLVQATTQFTVK